MAAAATAHAWLVAQALRPAAGSTSKRQPAFPSADPATLLGLSHPQTHAAAAATI
jgi:hypothetical protein